MFRDSGRLVGFDLIGEENVDWDKRLFKSIPLIEMQDALKETLALAKEEGVDDIMIPIMHSGEQSEAYGQKPSAQYMKNLEVAFNGGSKRIGHGIGIVLDENKELLKE
jgi:hypothetical protein